MTEANKLRERKIFNGYGIADLGDKVLVCFHKGTSRTCLPSWWGVIHIGFKPRGCAWYEHGEKTFTTNKKSNVDTLLKALKYGSKITKCYEWVKTPFGGYVSKVSADKVGFKYKKTIKI